MKRLIRLKTNHTRLAQMYVSDTANLKAGSIGYLSISCTLDSDWDNCKIIAVFRSGKIEQALFLDSNHECEIPKGILANKTFTVQLVGINSADYRIETNAITITQE